MTTGNATMDAVPANDDMSMLDLTSEVVAAYVSNNSVPVSELAAFIGSVHATLVRLTAPAPVVVAEPRQPAVSVRKSVQQESITCLCCARKFKSLKRHLMADHGLSPQEYRAMWALPNDYPMVAPAYAEARSNLAKTMGLGRKRADDAPVVEVDAPRVAAAAKSAQASKGPVASEPVEDMPTPAPKRRGRPPGRVAA